MSKVSPIVFIGVLIMFILPWVNISCQGKKVISINGIQMVTGTTIETPTMFGGKEKKKLGVDLFVILAFLMAVAGIVTGFIKLREKNIVSIILGILGVIWLLIFRGRTSQQIANETMGALQVDYGFGYWAALLFFLGAAGLNAFLFFQARGASLPAMGKTGATFRFCSGCGAQNTGVAIFCSECGHALK